MVGSCLPASSLLTARFRAPTAAALGPKHTDSGSQPGSEPRLFGAARGPSERDLCLQGACAGQAAGKGPGPLGQTSQGTRSGMAQGSWGGAQCGSR